MTVDPITPIPRAQYVQGEFSQIAGKYELMNQLMTFGFVNSWRRRAIHILDVQTGQIVVDLGAGGGQLTTIIRDQCPGCSIFPSDFNIPMMLAGAKTGLQFSAVDALALPYSDGSVDRVICAFLLRNIQDYDRALQEILRVLKPGGKFVSLDTTPPQHPILRPFIRFYMRVMIPFIGSLVTGRISAYSYLIRSSENFTPADKLATEIGSAGFTGVKFERIMFGTAAIHLGIKSE